MQLTQTHDYRRTEMAQAKTLTKDELARVLDYIDTRRFAQRNRAMMLLTHLAGLRIGEVACLRWSDVINTDGTVKEEIRLLATKGMLPSDDDTQGLTWKVRRDLGLRLPWLFNAGLVPESLRELSTCIKEDGNDGAHAGSLTSDDANDLLDFTSMLLERLYTEPERLRQASQRRSERRSQK
jgi:integrase